MNQIIYLWKEGYPLDYIAEVCGVSRDMIGEALSAYLAEQMRTSL
jgi:hypothetical protein